MSSPASLKRSHADTWLDDNLCPSNHDTGAAAQVAPSTQFRPRRSPSPANVPMPTGSGAMTNSVIDGPAPSTATVEKSNKRTKLTYAEKEARQIEKQFKELQKAEEKAKKEEEKAKKEEEEKMKKEAEKAKKEDEKRVRDAEKEERKRLKDEQAKAKEAEKRRKMEEKQKLEEEKNKKARV